MRRPPGHESGDINDRLPLVPHSFIGAPDCCGCLYVQVEGDQAEIICNECSAVIRTLPVADVERVMAELDQTDEICSARCPHCGAVNIFPGFSSMEAFICSQCGEGVRPSTSVQ